MKRVRDDNDDDDDVLLDSEAKRPAISQPGQVVQLSNKSSGSKLTTVDALSFLKSVKEFFEAEKDNKYDIFLKVMKDFKAQRVDTYGVISRVKELFKDNRDLILGFNTFLPKGHEITLPPKDEPLPENSPVTFEDALAFINKMKARFTENVYRDFIDILHKYQKNNKSLPEFYQEVSVLFENQADILVDFIHFLPGITNTVPAHYDQTLNNHVINGDGKASPMAIELYNHVEKWNNFEKDEMKKEDEGKNDGEIEGRRGHERKFGRRDDQFRREMKDLELCFRKKVKDRLQDPEVAEKCSDCIRAFMYMVITADDFRNLIHSLLGAHSDVMEACEDFLSYIDKNGSLWNNRRVFRSLKVKGEKDYHDGQDTEKNKDHNIRERDRHERGLSSTAKDVLGERIASGSKEKFLAKPIQELDLSNCESCTPSYRLLPENYPIPSTRRRTEIGDEVLNDRWVSVTSGSEDYSFKHMRKNQYEESLFRCEDDRFELDMLVESVKATAKRVEELIDSMNAHTIKTESSFCIEDHLTVLNLRCIERLYGDHGLDLMDVLRKNAPHALPVILNRLKQKMGEWERCRIDFNKVWAEIYAKNYHKSLDHRSFYFKQQDTKNLTSKALLANIRDLSLTDEDELLHSTYAWHSLPDKFHIDIKYPDPDIHEDIFQILKYSCTEICTPELSGQVLKTWSIFIEPMLGIPSRKGNDQASSGCGTKVMPSQESQKPNEETEGCGKAEREEGELSPHRNLEGNNFSASADADETCIENEGTETDTNGDDEDGQGSSESEDVTGNGNVSETESPNGEGENGGLDKKAESEGEAPFPDSLLVGVKPLNVKVPMALQNKEMNSQVFYGNDSFYLLFVLHQKLYERLLNAKVALSPEKRWTILNGANSSDLYASFKDVLYSLLNGTIGASKYEDECRTIIGSQSFTIFTLDKLILKLVKQLQTIVTGKVDTMLLQLCDYERSRSSETFTDVIYRANARFLLQRENMYRMEFFPSPLRMTIQLMKNYEHDEFDPMSMSKDPYFAAYLNNELLFFSPERRENPGLFLNRNKRMYSTGDEGDDFCKAMEGVGMHNGVVMRFFRDSNKVAYVLGTEDVFYRPKKARKIEDVFCRHKKLRKIQDIFCQTN